MKIQPVFDRAANSSKTDKTEESPVILERAAIWTQVFILLIIGVTTAGLIWSLVAQIEQAIPAQGKLEPEDAPKEVRAPVGGVVREVLVKEGEKVKQGDILLTFDPTASEADVESLRNLKEALIRENNFYTTAINGGTPSGGGSELESLLRERNALTEENDVFQTLIDEFELQKPGSSSSFNATQQTLWLAHKREYESIEETERSQVLNLEEKLSQTRGQLSSARIQKATSLQKLPNVEQQVRVAREGLPRAQRQVEVAMAQVPRAIQQLETSQRQLDKLKEQQDLNQQVLDLNEQILGQVSPLVAEGALSKLQMQRQQQEVLTRQGEIFSSESQQLTSQNDIEARQREILNAQSEIDARQREVLNAQSEIDARQREVLNVRDEIDARQAEIDRLASEAQQVEGQIDLARKDADGKKVTWLRDKRDKIQSNKQRLAQLDSEIGQKKQENQKQIAQINGQLTKAQQQLQYQELRSPVDGFVFDIKASPGFVAREVDQNPILKIVPKDKLVASVYINNKDIALVREGMPVDVNIEAFPSMEFGTIEGKLKSIGKDSLPPEPQERPYYSFPAKIELDRQAFKVNEQDIPIQSGMAVQVSIKIGKRTVMDMFIDRMNRKAKTLETVK